METLVDYDVVSEFAGHQSNKGVKVADAARDIFKRVKEKSMQMAVNGMFKTFDSVEELENILVSSISNHFSIRVFDEDFAGYKRGNENGNA